LSAINTLVLASGGIDSTAAIAVYLAKGFAVEALFVDYGQAAAKCELSAISQIVRHYQIPLTAISCGGLGRYSVGLVRGRNAFLLQCGLMAFRGSAGVIAIGVHAGTGYADCSPEFIARMTQVFDLYSDGKVTIGTPFLHWDKANIITFCRAHEVPLELTYSCETGAPMPCGVCQTCKGLEELYAVAR